MVRLAVTRNPRFKVSTVEISRPGVSYSIDTVRHFAKKSTEATHCFYYRPGCISGNRLMEEFCGDFSTL